MLEKLVEDEVDSDFDDFWLESISVADRAWLLLADFVDFADISLVVLALVVVIEAV